MPDDFQSIEPKSKGPDSVVVLVHGIRTRAPWVAMLRAEFEKAGIKVEPTNYGRLDAVRFWLPISSFRHAPVKEVWDLVREVRRLYPDARISFLAHSFGTFIVSKILEQEFDFKAHRVVFCGSVVNYKFPFRQLSERFTHPLVNEVSSNDFWPALAESSTWGYGSAGTYGFRVPRVRDRWHRGFGHSQYLDAEFCRKYWIPFFREGEIVEGDTVSASPPLWVRLLSILRLRYLVPLSAVGIAALMYVAEVSYLRGPDDFRIGPFERTLTASRLREFQRIVCLPEDGVFGPSTRQAILNHLRSLGAKDAAFPDRLTALDGAYLRSLSRSSSRCQ